MSSFSFPNIRKIRLEYHWLVTIAVTLGMFMSLMDSTIVVVAIPQMERSFNVDIHSVQWVVTIYMLTQAAVIPTAPYLTTKFGGKRTYVWTLSAFLLGSLLCGFAWNLPSLVLFRFVQGIGGGILLPMVMTLLYEAFPPEQRGTATGVMGVPLMIAPTFGPVLGGYLVSSFGWQWAFFINIPIGIVAVIIAQKILRQVRPEQQARFDGSGFLAVALGIVVLLYAVSEVASGAFTALNIALLVTGMFLLFTFVIIELFKARSGRFPLLDMRRMGDRTFAFSVLALVLVMFVRFGIYFLVPIYLQTLLHKTAWEAGAIQGSQALATLAILPLAGKLADTIGAKRIVLIGLALLVGIVALMTLLTLDTALWFIVGILVLLGGAYACIQQLPVAAMSGIRKEESKEVANGSTLINVLQATAAPLGVAVLSSFVTARSLQYKESLGIDGAHGVLLQLQSLLFAMHDAFLISSILLVGAFIVMCIVPGKRSSTERHGEQAVLEEDVTSVVLMNE